MKFFTFLAAVLLCGISLFCSVMLWYSEQPTLMGGLIFGGFAAGLEICKFIFFPFAARASRWTKLGLNIFGSLLIVFSIFATVSYLENGANATIDNERNASFEYQTQLKTIENIESKIQINLQSKAKAVENNYRKEGRSYDITLNKLAADKQGALLILKRIRIQSTNGTHSIFDSMASRLNIDLVTVRQISYLIIAILVDLGGIRCLMILTNKETYLETQTRENKGLDPVSDPVPDPVLNSDSVVDPDPLVDLNPISDPVLKPVLDPDLTDIQKGITLILSGKLGDNPSINKVAKICGVGKPKAKLIIEHAKRAKTKNKVISIKDRGTDFD